jgi:hypothetical protein
MAPPKQKEASQSVRPTRVKTRSRVHMEEGEQQPLEIINVRRNPISRHNTSEPNTYTGRNPTVGTKGTNIDISTEVQEQLNQDAETLKEVQPENTEAAPKVNGMTPNLKTAVEPNESQMTISDHPTEGTVEDVSSWLEWYTEEQPEAAGTSSQPPPPQKDKIQIPRSPRKKPATEIILPWIPDGVQVGPDLLGYIGKLKYSDHDVADEDKFLELAKRVYMETVGTNPFGEPISQPLQWETGLEKT